MKTNKTSKSSNKIIETSAAPLNDQIIKDSKPVKRTTTSSAPAKATSSKSASHRHSKANAHVTPMVDEVTIQTAPAIPTNDDIASLAHAFWVERNYAHGFAAEDWFRAEKALMASR